ncbi:MAG: TRAP transporter small permease [Verrucomicrobiae bacterium]|nr:TRAP transporter small permease [Verrucomicrobiae bacterium]
MGSEIHPRPRERHPMAEKVGGWLTRLLRGVVLALAAVSGLSLLVMVALTCAEVVLRAVFNAPIKGTVDMIGLLCALAMICALPYTTAIKGHVAVEYFFLKLGRRGRIAADTLLRLVLAAFFVLLGWYLARYGQTLYTTGQVSQTVQLPLFWLPYVMAFCCWVIVGIKIYHIFHPGQSLLKP